MKNRMLALGMMSGTSMDGIDAAILETDGEAVQSFGPTIYKPWSEDERSLLMQTAEEARSLQDFSNIPESFADTGQMLTKVHAEVALSLCDKNNIATDNLDLIGFHGQTVVHRPQQQITIQLGDPQLLADSVGCDVVFDLRQSDITQGGEGAPLAPVYHKALADYLGLERPVCFLNTGGVANLTYIDQQGELIAFDTGPANALMDDWVQRHTGETFDKDGELAAAGSVHSVLLSQLLENPYFLQKPPKSLDRNDFSKDLLQGLSLEDGTATLLAFSVQTIAKGLKLLPEQTKKIIVCGGGAKNPTFMQELRKIGDFELVSADTEGLNSDFIEAQAFAFMAVRSQKGLPITFPGTTGVSQPLTGGRLFKTNSQK